MSLRRIVRIAIVAVSTILAVGTLSIVVVMVDRNTSWHCERKFDEQEIAAAFRKYVARNAKFLGLETESPSNGDFVEFRFDYSQPFVFVQFGLRERAYVKQFAGTYDRCGRIELSF